MSRLEKLAAALANERQAMEYWMAFVEMDNNLEAVKNALRANLVDSDNFVPAGTYERPVDVFTYEMMREALKQLKQRKPE